MLRRVAALAVVYAALMVAWWALDWTQTYVTPGARRIPAFDRAVWVERPAWIAAGVLVLVLAWRIGRELRGPGLHKWGTARWNRALEDAGLIKDPAAKGAKPAPRARMVGKVRTDQDGATHVILKLPVGLVVGQVQGRRDHIAASLDMPPERLHFGRHQDRTGVLTIRIDPPGFDLTPRIPQMPRRTSWRDPILLGRDMRGKDVTVSTWDVPQWLIGGTSGSGKTVAMRMILAHYALDPDAILWGVDGKGNRDDWAGVKPRFDRWVSATDRVNGPADYLQMLEDLGELIDERQDVSGRDYPGMLVLMDDAPQLRRRLNGTDKARADDLLTGIVQTCRAVNILCLVTTQKPSQKQMDTDQRSQAGLALCMQVDNLDDARMVLGVRPKEDAVVTFPVGHGLLKAERGEPRRVAVDWLTDRLWAKLGDRLTWEADRRAAAARPVLTLIRGDGESEQQDAPAPQDVNPLLAAAVEAVESAPDRRMTTAEILASIPDGLAASPGERMLGRELSALGWPARSEWVGGKTVRYRYADDAPTDARRAM